MPAHSSVPGAHRPTSHLLQPLVHTPDVRTLGRLAILPELLLCVFDEIDDMRDAIALGATHWALFALGIRHIYALAAEAKAKWAGCRIICLGDYVRNDDLPPGFLTAAEEREMHECGVNLFNYATNHFRLVYELGWYIPRPKFWYNVPPEMYTALIALAHGGYSSDPSAAWVLCSLTRHEYVRAEATAALSPNRKPCGPLVDGAVGLGEVLVSLICWSYDPSTAIPYHGPLHRGRWAGDRVEITTIGRLRDGVGAWRDVSEEVLGVVAEIWNAEYCGSSWQGKEEEEAEDEDKDEDEDKERERDERAEENKEEEKDEEAEEDEEEEEGRRRRRRGERGGVNLTDLDSLLRPHHC
ncbi:hypothetical protein BKA93DRAFT_735690 [Sparassis latifolia]